MVQKNNNLHGENNSLIPRRGTLLLVGEDREDLDYYRVILSNVGIRFEAVNHMKKRSTSWTPNLSISSS